MPNKNDFFSILTDAINDMSRYGFDSVDRVAFWSEKLRKAAQESLTPPAEMDRMLRDAMVAGYRRLVEQGGIAKYHSGVARFTIDKVKPQLRAELDRRIMASAQLIKLNREDAIRKTLQRFQGWSISIPKGGSDAVDKRDEKAKIRKSLTQMPYEDRRVLIDQGQKLSAALSDIIAVDGGALAAEWHSRYRELNYDYREDHKERDGNIYTIRGNWALEKGLMKVGPAGYTDEITQPAEEVYCRCKYRYIYNVSKLPKDMITKKGEAELARVKAELV